jgi:predicted secreted protein
MQNKSTDSIDKKINPIIKLSLQSRDAIFFYQIYIYCGIWRGQFVVVVGFGRSSTQPSKTLKLRTMPTVPHSSRIQVRTVHLHFMASTRTVTNWYILCYVLSISCRPIPSSWSNTPVSSNPSFTKSASIYHDGLKKKRISLPHTPVVLSHHRTTQSTSFLFIKGAKKTSATVASQPCHALIQWWYCRSTVLRNVSKIFLPHCHLIHQLELFLFQKPIGPCRLSQELARFWSV